VRLSIELTENGPRVDVSDDGRGFDVNGLVERGRHAGLSVVSAFEVALTPGLSTTSSTNELSGAGVGLSAAREELLSIGYDLTLAVTSSCGTTLRLLPLARREPILRGRHVG
jgi:chemotaxis protein histidine kinase CheA